MPSRKDIEAQIAALTKELEADADGTHEVWIREGNREFKVTGERAKTVLGRFSDLWEVREEPADETADEPVETDETPKKTTYFRKK